jgi:hypothetical protein
MGTTFDALFNMSNLALYTILIAALVTLMTSVVAQSHWSALAKQITCVVVSLVASGVYIVVQADTWHQYVRMALLVIVGATLFFKLFEPGMRELNAKTTVTAPNKK